jgi:exodeoxyribonuclease V alpha subunit
VLPATIQGIQRYLGSGLIKGIGPVMAERMVACFGTDILRIIEEGPERLVEVPDLGPKRTKLVTAAWEEQKAIKEVNDLPPGRRGVHLAGRADLQEIQGRLHRGSPP